EDRIKGAFEQFRPYTVRLYFAETEGYKIGQRLFNVSLQGRQVMENFDIAREAGATNRSVVKEFNRINIKDDLRITLTPTTASQADPLICGIEIIAEKSESRRAGTTSTILHSCPAQPFILCSSPQPRKS
ncbi:MAG: malectin domain-containing carbohydrate-binding protein, partial [Planctomycetota bacterium]